MQVPNSSLALRRSSSVFLSTTSPSRQTFQTCPHLLQCRHTTLPSMTTPRSRTSPCCRYTTQVENLFFHTFSSTCGCETTYPSLYTTLSCEHILRSCTRILCSCTLERGREKGRSKEIVIKMAKSSDLYQTVRYHTASYGGCALNLCLLR